MSFIIFISFFAIINSIVLSFYFLSKPTILLNRLISAILFAIVEYISYYLVVYTRQYAILQYMLPINFTVSLGALPLLSMIIENLMYGPKANNSKKRLLHFIPMALTLILFLWMYLKPDNYKSNMLNQVMNGRYPAVLLLLNFAFIIQFPIYLTNCYRKINAYKKANINSDKAKVIWNFMILFAFICLIFCPIFIANSFNFIPVSSLLITHSFFTIFMTNFILFVAIRYPNIFTIYENIKPATGNPSSTKKLSDETIEKITNSIQKLIIEEQIYKDKKIDIAIFADKCNVPKYLLVQFLNQHYGKTFPDFINEYRIDEAKKILSGTEWQKYSIDIIAEKCGFNYRSSFYSAFKKQTGMSPMQYVKAETVKMN